MKIQVVGSGCARCKAVEANVAAACRSLGLAAELSHVYDMTEFPKLGVTFTPAVLVDGAMLVSGRVPPVEELKTLLVRHGATVPASSSP